MNERLIVDGHVHVHACYDEAAFLSAAHANLVRQGDGFPTLMLAEMSGVNVFARWRTGEAAWPVTPTDESSSLILGGRLLVVAGRQIVTSERIEVLAQATTESFADGEPLDMTIERVVQSGALAVLPWGVGKWLGARGRKVALAAARYPVLLGDNAGRPVGWPAPDIFRRRPVLPGSDPLRLSSQQRMAGTYGFQLIGRFDPARPAEHLRTLLLGLTDTPPWFGRRVGVFDFLCQQCGLRLTR